MLVKVVAGFHTGDSAWARAMIPAMATDSTRRLHHGTPAWAGSGATFHIRIRSLSTNLCAGTESGFPAALLNSALYYHETGRWHCRLFLLMPDHLHALLCFPADLDMWIAIGRWKAWQTREHCVVWQSNFFDHRIRSPHELQLKAEYIRQNPVVKGLCRTADDWPWAIAPGPMS